MTHTQLPTLHIFTFQKRGFSLIRYLTCCRGCCLLTQPGQQSGHLQKRVHTFCYFHVRVANFLTRKTLSNLLFFSHSLYGVTNNTPLNRTYPLLLRNYLQSHVKIKKKKNHFLARILHSHVDQLDQFLFIFVIEVCASPYFFCVRSTVLVSEDRF